MSITFMAYMYTISEKNIQSADQISPLQHLENIKFAQLKAAECRKCLETWLEIDFHSS